MKPQRENMSGIGLGVMAFSLFAALPAYVQLLKPLPGYAVLAQRILWTTLIIAMVLVITRRIGTVIKPVASRKPWPGLLLGSLLVGLQWLLFIWAPLNGRTLELSLGYFLLPIVMVFIGRVWLGERLRLLQKAAVIAAVTGVAVAYWHAGGLSWIVFLVAMGWPAYFLLRRYQPLPTLTAFFCENLLLLPLAVWSAIHFGGVGHPFAYPADWLLRFVGLALLGAVPMLCLLAASRRLPVSIFGLLSYLEPVLIFLVAVVVLREPLAAGTVWIYAAFTVALGLLAMDGLASGRR